MIRKNILYIYTDGSMTKKVRTGGMGLAYVYLDKNEEEVVISQDLEGIKGATSNQMEIKAVSEGFRLLNKQDITIEYNRIEVRTDSKYVVDNFYNAAFIWPKNSWCNRDGKPLANEKEWKELIKERRKIRCPLEITKVKGHSKDKYNKKADSLADQSVKNAQKIILVQTDVRRKIFKGSTKVGSIQMKGQKIDINILTAILLKRHNLTKYRYEVISRRSEFFTKIDFIYSSDHSLRIGHCYKVILNRNSKFPQIDKVVSEIPKPKPEKNGQSKKQDTKAPTQRN